MLTDDLRILDRVNTQVRHLPTLSHLLKFIGTRTISIDQLNRLMQRWSSSLEEESDIYANSSGIITTNKKLNAGLPHYIDFSTQLGLVSKINNVLRCSKYGAIYLDLNKCEDNTIPTEISILERIFYTFNILQKDADNILTIMSSIENNSLTMKELCEIYEPFLKQRLKLKIKNAKSATLAEISEKIRRIEYIWKNPTSYARHIVPQRIEWLISLGLLQDNKLEASNIRKITLSKTGRSFIENISSTHNKSIDVTNDWLLNDLFIFFSENPINEHTDLEYIKYTLQTSYKVLDTDGLRRVSSLPFFLYCSMKVFLETKKSFTWNQLQALLTSGFSTDGFILTLRKASRINESYITANIK